VRRFLPEDVWERRQKLAFALELHRADCELWTGAQPLAEETSGSASQRALLTRFNARPSQADALISTRCFGASDRAVEVGLEFLRHVGIDWTAHPTELEHVAYDLIWLALEPESRGYSSTAANCTIRRSLATLDVLTTLGAPTLFTDQICSCSSTAGHSISAWSVVTGKATPPSRYGRPAGRRSLRRITMQVIGLAKDGRDLTERRD